MKMRERVNRHHVFFERAAYQRDPVLRTLRQQPGLIVPMYITEHQALHRALNRQSLRQVSVPKPDRDAARHFIQNILLPYTPEQPRIQALEQAIGWFAMTNNELTAEHLAAQRDFITKTTPFGDERAIDGQREMDRGRFVVLTEREPFTAYPEIPAA